MQEQSPVNKFCDIPTSKLGHAIIGPAAWRNNTLREIRNATSAMEKSDMYNESTRSTKPVPHLRDVLADLSNDEAHRYFRETRLVVVVMRENLIDLNEEIKSLTRGREWLERTLDHIRKDIKLNEDTKDLRGSRPAREKVPIDGADSEVFSEKLQLANLKRSLESHLLTVRQHLMAADRARQRLINVIKERSRVLELINVSPSCRSQVRSSVPGGERLCDPFAGRQIRSADPDIFRSELPPVDSLGPYTPECEAALVEAKDARERCKMLKRTIRDAVDRTNRVQTFTHRSVNDALTGRIAETADLVQQLNLTSGENRTAIGRTQKWYNNTEQAFMLTQGPESTRNITLRENLTRPIVKVFQRHPGNNLPEAQEIVRSGEDLLNSLRRTGQNLGMLRLAQVRLRNDIRDKNGGLNVDANILRMRRSKANHRWITGGVI